MARALRLYLEEGSRESRKGEALPRLYRHAPKLDRLCRRLALQPLSRFHDHSGTSKVPSGVSDTIKIMVKSKPWFPVADGLATLVPLLRWLEQNPTRFGLLSDDYRGVLEELRLCVAGLEARPPETCRFNLCASQDATS
jgi:hypothetical protein